MTSKSELVRAIRHEYLNMSHDLWRELCDECSTESFSVCRLSEMPTEKLQRMLNKAKELARQ